MIKNGPLNNYYILEDIHWHWNGTEHTIEGKKDERWSERDYETFQWNLLN